jgi:hypothetical protein
MKVDCHGLPTLGIGVIQMKVDCHGLPTLGIGVI